MNELEMAQDEEVSLKMVIEDYETRTETQLTLALAVLRGYDTFETASAYLGIPNEELAEANQSLWGILLDSSTGKLWIK